MSMTASLLTAIAVLFGVCLFIDAMWQLAEKRSTKDRERTELLENTIGQWDYKTSAKISFEQFASFYAINPDAWILKEWCVERKTNKEIDFSPPNDIVEKVKLRDALMYDIQSLNNIMFYSLETKRVYFSSIEDTKAYHEFYLEVKKEMKRRADEEKRQKELKEETQNTADVIKMVVEDIEGVKDLAQKQREEALDRIAGVMEKRSYVPPKTIYIPTPPIKKDEPKLTLDIALENAHTGAVVSRDKQNHTATHVEFRYPGCDVKQL